MAGLRKEATQSVLWVAVERLGQQLLQAVIFIILARLLSPEDFGLVAMLIIFFAIAQTFIDSGMSQALIREKEITDADRSTVFWFNMALSIATYAILFFAAPAIASFYNQPELILLTRVMGVNILFFAIATVQRAELTQQMEFKKQAMAQIPAMLIAGVVSIIMAYNGFGVWSIVAQYLSFSLFGSLGIWLLKPSKLKFIWSRESFDRLFGFGNKLLISGLINTIFEHLYKIVIGKIYPPSILGYYTQAQRLQRLASNNMANILQKATYPLLAKTENQGGDLKSGYSKVIMIASAVIFPTMVALFILAEPFLGILLGEKWLPAVPYFRFLAVVGMFYHLNLINLNVLKVKGRTDLFLRLEIIKKSIVSVAVVVGVFFGIEGLLIGQVCTAIIAFFINSVYTARFIDYSTREQIQDVLNVFVLVIPMAIVGGAIWYFFPVNGLIMLIFAAVILMVTYILTSIVVKNKSSMLMQQMAKPLLKKVFK